MLDNGSVMFLLIPSATNERVLHPGKVLESDGEGFCAGFEKPFTIEAGADVNVFAEFRGKFYQQGASVMEVRQGGPVPVVAFKRVGERVSAESRQTFRVVVAMAGITAQIENEKKCQVVDLSPEGFAAIVAKELQIGSMVRINLVLEGQLINTSARVQTLKKLPSGKLRFGFLVPDKKNPARPVLEQSTASFQRMHLRRLSGAA